MKTLLLLALLGAASLHAQIIVVANTNDTGAGSLRQAVLDATGGETITFGASLNGGTITLASGQIVIDKELTIDASALAAGLTIDATGNSRHFSITDGNEVNVLDVAIEGLTLINGQAGNGGSIFNLEALTLTNCSFQGNRASNGGGIYNYFSSSTLTNCSFQGNRASNGGGGILNIFSSPTLTNCSFQGNSATLDGGGGIYNFSSSPTLTNCILWNNAQGGATNVTGASVANLTSTPTYYNSLIANSGGSSSWNTALGNDGGGNIDADPLFVLEVDPLDAPTTGGDLRLQGGSPAVDVGDDAANATTTDLAGYTRKVGSTIDLGAHEQQVVLYVDDTAGGANDGSSWTNAYTDLQVALAAASSGVQIQVAQGTYLPTSGTDRTISFELVDETLLLGGYPDGGGTRDPAANPTILSGDLLQNDGDNFTGNAYHVLTAGSGITAATHLDGFTITAGNANGSSPNDRGAGLYCDSASPTLSNCSFQGNSATSGGGIANYNSSSPTLTNCSFLGNSATSGGGINNNYSSPILTNCSFQGNRADYGGGIYNFESSSTLNNCSFQGNRATISGGGIYNQYSSSTLTNCSFQGNRANYGGGIYNVEYSSTLNNCSFQGNRATISGGGIFNASSSSTLNNCILWNNSQGGTANVTGASVANLTSTPTYSHCLVANSGGSSAWDSALGTDGGNNIDADPLFVLEVDPLTAPTTDGDLRLLGGSPAIDVGNSAANATTTDLAGNTRKVGTIDLGAFEGNVDATFALLHPRLDPDADDNLNGITNYGDYAAGGDPTAPNDPSLQPMINGDQLTFSFRNNAADVFTEFQKSGTLLSGSWSEMVEGVDYSISDTTVIGGQTLQTLDLLTTDPKQFFREVFSESAE